MTVAGYPDNSTAYRVLQALEPHRLVCRKPGEYKANIPWRNSDSGDLSVTITSPDGEHGAYYDGPHDSGGSLYQLAHLLNIDTSKTQGTATSGKTFADLAAFAEAHYAPVEAYKAAGWKDDRKQHAGKMRPAVRFTTATGYRWRFLDTEKPKYLHGADYTASWYGLDRAIQLAAEQGNPLVLCNGEASTVAAQWWNVPAACISGGAERELPADLLAVLKAKWRGPILIALDSDEKGRKAAAKLHAQLMAAGYTVRTADLGGGAGFDLADYCGLHQHQSVAALGTAPELIAPGLNPIKPLVQKNVPAFPTNALPLWARAFVEAEAHSKQTPADLQAGLLLAVLSTCLARKVRVQVQPGWYEPVNVMTVSALEPGSNKSGSFRAMIAPLVEYEQQHATQSAVMVEQSKAAKELLDERIRTAKTAVAKAKTTRDEDVAQAQLDDLIERRIGFVEQHAFRLIVDDATSEALASRLIEQGGRIAVLSPEADPFNILAGRYADAPNFDIYLRGHAGDDIRIDRKGRPAEFVRLPALTVGVTIQPEVLRDIAGIRGSAGRGLLGRFLYSVPASLIGYRNVDAAATPEAVRKTYHDAVTALLERAMRLGAGGDGTDHVLSFTPEARVTFQAFRRWLEPQCRKDGLFGHMTDWAGKLAGTVARIAGLLYMAERIGDEKASQPTSIGCDTVERAIAIGLYYAAHARMVFHDMRADGSLEDARTVLRHLDKLRPSEVSARDIFQRVKGGQSFKRAADLAPVLELLADHGYLIPVEAEERTGRGRPPSPKYTLHPHAFNPHETAGDGSIPAPFTFTPHGDTYERGYRPLDTYDAPEITEQPMNDELFTDDEAPKARPAHTPGVLSDAAAMSARNNEWGAQNRLKQAWKAARRKLEAAVHAITDPAIRRSYDAFEDAVTLAPDDAAAITCYYEERTAHNRQPEMLALLDLWYAEIQALIAYAEAGGDPSALSL